MADEALTAGAVARRLGVAVTTLRTWHQRYGLGPSQHVPGQHRRYTPEDMARLQVMRRLTGQGVAPAEAAAWARRVPMPIDVSSPVPGSAPGNPSSAGQAAGRERDDANAGESKSRPEEESRAPAPPGSAGTSSSGPSAHSDPDEWFTADQQWGLSPSSATGSDDGPSAGSPTSGGQPAGDGRLSREASAVAPSPGAHAPHGAQANDSPQPQGGQATDGPRTQDGQATDGPQPQGGQATHGPQAQGEQATHRPQTQGGQTTHGPETQGLRAEGMQILPNGEAGQTTQDKQAQGAQVSQGMQTAGGLRAAQDTHAAQDGQAQAGQSDQRLGAGPSSTGEQSGSRLERPDTGPPAQHQRLEPSGDRESTDGRKSTADTDDPDRRGAAVAENAQLGDPALPPATAELTPPQQPAPTPPSDETAPPQQPAPPLAADVPTPAPPRITGDLKPSQRPTPSPVVDAPASPRRPVTEPDPRDRQRPDSDRSGLDGALPVWPHDGDPGHSQSGSAGEARLYLDGAAIAAPVDDPQHPASDTFSRVGERRPTVDAVWPGQTGRMFVARDGGGHAIRTGRAGPAARGLARAAMRLDGPALRDILEMTVTDRGVVAAWEEVIMPVLIGVGERYAATKRFIEVEHLLSRGVTEVLGSVTRPPSSQSPRVLLAAADEEQHTLPLEALAAALAQAGVPSRLLGARVPAQAVAETIARTGPAVLVLWSQLPGDRRSRAMGARALQQTPPPARRGRRSGLGNGPTSRRSHSARQPRAKRSSWSRPSPAPRTGRISAGQRRVRGGRDTGLDERAVDHVCFPSLKRGRLGPTPPEVGNMQ